MLETLAGNGTRVVRYGREDPRQSADLAALLAAFASVGLEVLGPTRSHLLACARRIAAAGRDAVDAIGARLERDSGLDLAALWRELRARPGAAGSDAADGGFSLGAAINDQSLVLSLAVGDRRVLLTGDMQLAQPGFPAVEAEVAELRARIAAAAPYALVKLAHHGARNAVDPGVLRETGATLFAISGGYGSALHPHPETLAALATAQPPVIWYRTDRNGLVSVDLSRPETEVGWSRGETSETGLNPDAEDLPAGPAAVTITPSEAVTRVVARAPAGEPGEVVEVVARVPHRRTRVVITIEVEPAAGEAPPASTLSEPSSSWEPRSDLAAPLAVADGRTLPPLLFATDPDALALNLGAAEARAVRAGLEALAAAGHGVVFERFARMGPSQAGVQIRQALDAAKMQGIVLVGGYDVIPPDSVDVLSAEHRRAIDPRYDADRFVVWSDDFYGDLDDDGLPELPVSRVPDGRSAVLLRAALGAGLVEAPARRAGLRNLKRDFAAQVFAAIPGGDEILVSDPATPAAIASQRADYFAAEAIYLMLHGRSANARSFQGETDAGDLVEAIDRRNLRPCPGAVVFTGCCWGALIVETTAWSHNPGEGFAPRSPEASLALGFLGAGANAFIGCTGVHDSPTVEPFGYASGPLHRAFWKHLLVDRLRPAAALLAAKRSYLVGIPYPSPMPDEEPGAAAAAVEKKLLAQFTCLGLGW